MIPFVNRRLNLTPECKPPRSGKPKPPFKAVGTQEAGYYILRSRLAENVYKLGVTTNLERRMLEHGGRAKHEVVRWLPMPEAAAYALERKVKTRFHRYRVTDGNEIFVLTDEVLHDLMSLLDQSVDS